MRIFYLVVLTSLINTVVSAQDLVFDIKVDPTMTGSRAWDGTGVSSTVIDGHVKPLNGVLSELTTLPDLGALTEMGGQILIDQVDDVISAADPVVCIVEPHTSRTICDEQTAQRQNQSDFSYAVHESFNNPMGLGIILFDSDSENITGGQNDLIGLGVFLNESTYTDLINGDAAARELAQLAEASVLSVARSYNLLRPRSDYRDTEIAKISFARCEASSCRIGSADIRLRRSVDGW